MQDIDSVLSHLHSEDVAVEVDGLSAVAHLEHPVQGTSAQLQSHILCVFSPASATTDRTCTRGGLKILNETGVNATSTLCYKTIFSVLTSVPLLILITYLILIHSFWLYEGQANTDTFTFNN